MRYTPSTEQWKPTLAVVMPCYNAERTLGEAVRSVLAQTYTDWELVIIDDGSSDQSPEIIRDFASQDSRIWSARNDKPSGAAAARNTALHLTRARYVAFLDSDDAWLPNKLAVQMRAMQQHEAALCCAAYDVMDGSGRITGHVRPPAGRLTYRGLLANCEVGSLTAVLDRSLCGDVRFTSDLRTGEDYQLWLSVLQRGLTGICIGETLALYRVHGKTLSSNKLLAARNRWRVYREFQHHNLITSAFYFSLYALTGVTKVLSMQRKRILGQA